MSYDLLSCLGKPFWTSGLVETYAADSGEKPEVNDVLGETFCSFRKAGFSSVLSQQDASIQVIHIFYSEPGFTRFSKPLPYSLTFDMSRKDVETRLGNPSRSGGGVRNPIDGGIVPEWIRYDRRIESIHVQFRRDERGQQGIGKITLMTPQRVSKIG